MSVDSSPSISTKGPKNPNTLFGQIVFGMSVTQQFKKINKIKLSYIYIYKSLSQLCGYTEEWQGVDSPVQLCWYSVHPLSCLSNITFLELRSWCEECYVYLLISYISVAHCNSKASLLADVCERQIFWILIPDLLHVCTAIEILSKNNCYLVFNRSD